MILADIYIPAVDANYDFMLDENVKEKKPGQIADFVLYSMDTGTLLDHNLSLYANGVHDGSRLIFV